MSVGERSSSSGKMCCWAESASSTRLMLDLLAHRSGIGYDVVAPYEVYDEYEQKLRHPECPRCLSCMPIKQATQMQAWLELVLPYS